MLKCIQPMHQLKFLKINTSYISTLPTYMHVLKFIVLARYIILYFLQLTLVSIFLKCLAVSNPPSFHWLSTVLTYTHSSLTLLWEILAAEAGLLTYPHPPKTTRSPSAAMPRGDWSQFSQNVHFIIAHHMQCIVLLTQRVDLGWMGIHCSLWQMRSN